MVVTASPTRRTVLVARMRALGARDVIEAASGAEARIRAAKSGGGDLVIIEGGLPDGPILPVLADLRRHGWRRVVLLTPRADAYAVRAAVSAGIRGYVVIPENREGFLPTPARTTGRGAPDELSGREVEVIGLVAEGRSNKEIGETLGLSALTVKSHLARIARKLGTGDRAEMVAVTMRTGVVR